MVDDLPPKTNLRPVEIAKFLDLSLTNIYALIASGELPTLKIRRSYRIPRAPFLAWYNSQFKENERGQSEL
jgi:excisionase family DNA binding protein